MDMSVQGKVIVVTGAAQGIGRALAEGLAAGGAQVAVVARDLDRARAVAEPIGGLAVAADVSDEQAVRAAAATVDRAYGRVDGLINNAGWLGERRPVLQMDLDLVRRSLGSNLISGYLTTKHFAPLMIRGGGGRIIYMSSIAAVQAAAGGSVYGPAKAALNQLSAIVHLELANDGIRTVAIAPGLTVTPGMQAFVTEEHLARVSGRYPGGRVGQPEDLVGLCTFLCSDAAEHLSGTVITVRPPV
jgi:NAD(P)-dependent dehydrogenase (short-subunit alcohol dehydrogenase family)